jgi:hypothetical protein
MIGAIILGIVAGYVGRLLMPGKDEMGFLATMLLRQASALDQPAEQIPDAGQQAREETADPGQQPADGP